MAIPINTVFPLIELIDRLDEVDESDRFASPCLFAEGGPDATEASRAVVNPSDDEGGLTCPTNPSLEYVLMVQQAKEAIRVWSLWRKGACPTRGEKIEAVMYYARHDAWLPVG